MEKETPPRQADIGMLRILDAAANRAREGLRVIEDCVRFGLDDANLTENLKKIRHELSDILSVIPWPDRLAARETQADVGTHISTSAEYDRKDLSSVLTANFLRIQESLRSLEEVGKIAFPAMAPRIEQIRYAAYTVQRAVLTTEASLTRLRDARLYVLMDGMASTEKFKNLLQELIGAGVDIIQLRDKLLADRELLGRARLLRELTRGTKTLAIINDRPDLAALSMADGVHIGQEELSVKDARSIVAPKALIGVSTHSIEQARQAVLDGANYIGVGPAFPSKTKDFDHFPGTQLLREVAAEIQLPAFAIGGITIENLPEVLSTGIKRIATCGAIVASGEPASMAREFKSALLHGRQGMD